MRSPCDLFFVRDGFAICEYKKKRDEELGA